MELVDDGNEDNLDGVCVDVDELVVVLMWIGLV